MIHSHSILRILLVMLTRIIRGSKNSWTILQMFLIVWGLIILKDWAILLTALYCRRWLSWLTGKQHKTGRAMKYYSRICQRSLASRILKSGTGSLPSISVFSFRIYLWILLRLGREILRKGKEMQIEIRLFFLVNCTTSIRIAIYCS